MYDWTIDTPLRQIIEEALGGASMCWEHPERAGRFHPQAAKSIADEVMLILNQKLLGAPKP